MSKSEVMDYMISVGYTYDKDSGLVYKNGKVTGSKLGCPYKAIGIRIYRHKYSVYLHRFAWYYSGNTLIDDLVIDHINRNKLDNRLCNLQQVTQHKNVINSKIRNGYYYDKRRKSYLVRVQFDKKTIHIGSFKTSEEAHQAYLDAKKIHHII